jgi:hypothetical protein
MDQYPLARAHARNAEDQMISNKIIPRKAGGFLEGHFFGYRQSKLSGYRDHFCMCTEMADDHYPCSNGWRVHIPSMCFYDSCGVVPHDAWRFGGKRICSLTCKHLSKTNTSSSYPDKNLAGTRYWRRRLAYS